jgi:hypothetical protein
VRTGKTMVSMSQPVVGLAECQLFLIFLLNPQEVEKLKILSALLTPIAMKKYSAQYAQTLWRMTPFIASQHRPTRFLTTADELEWGPRTRHTYYGAVMTLLKLTQLQPSAEDRSLWHRWRAKRGVRRRGSWRIHPNFCQRQ